MRIGTWNIAGRLWKSGHEELVLRARCDVWLLTEVHQSAGLPGFDGHVTNELMGPRKWWAGVFTRLPFKPLDDPHPASAAVEIDGVTYCSTILPWKGSGGDAPWVGDTHAERTRHALLTLVPRLAAPALVWGGDWNHSLYGDEQAGSLQGRQHIRGAVDLLGLRVPTEHLRHRIPQLGSIDHIGVPTTWPIQRVEHWPAEGLSDHDAYVVEVADV